MLQLPCASLDYDQRYSLKKIEFGSHISQRKLAEELNLSLGKVKYC
jgi:hypothetical protein